MSTLQADTTQTEAVLSERLKRAYRRVSPRLRTEAARAFATHHRTTVDTFRKKCCGDAVVTELECIWMEEYKGF